MKDWLLSHWEPIAATIVTAIVIPFLMRLWDSITGRRRDEQLAATMLLPHVIKYKLYWVNRYHEDQTEQPDPEAEFQWSGDRFEAVLSSEKIEATAARLSKPLRIKIFELEMLAYRWKSAVSLASEYYTDNIDIIGPLAVAEIALASHDLLEALAKEAGVPTPDMGHDMDFIQSAAETERRNREEWKKKDKNSRRRLSDELTKSIEKKAMDP
jgi:hypothetical protein